VGEAEPTRVVRSNAAAAEVHGKSDDGAAAQRPHDRRGEAGAPPIKGPHAARLAQARVQCAEARIVTFASDGRDVETLFDQQRRHALPRAEVGGRVHDAAPRRRRALERRAPRVLEREGGRRRPAAHELEHVGEHPTEPPEHRARGGRLRAEGAPRVALDAAAPPDARRPAQVGEQRAQGAHLARGQARRGP
jgi:hypothetical protein